MTSYLSTLVLILSMSIMRAGWLASSLWMVPSSALVPWRAFATSFLTALSSSLRRFFSLYPLYPGM